MKTKIFLIALILFSLSENLYSLTNTPTRTPTNTPTNTPTAGPTCTTVPCQDSQKIRLIDGFEITCTNWTLCGGASSICPDPAIFCEGTKSFSATLSSHQTMGMSALFCAIQNHVYTIYFDIYTNNSSNVLFYATLNNASGSNSCTCPLL